MSGWFVMPKEAVMPSFISVYSKATGEKHRVPEHFLDVPSIAQNFNKTPRQRKRDADETPVATNIEAALVAETETPPAGDKKE